MNTMENARLLGEAARDGNVEEIERLLPIVTSMDHRTYALQWAAEEGQIWSLRALLPFSDPRVNNSWALRCAAKNGHTQCVKLLIPVSDPKSSKALMQAVKNNNIECVKLLLPVSDPQLDNSAVLQIAALENLKDMMDILFDVCDAQAALTALQNEYPEKPAAGEALQEKINQRQNKLLRHNIGEQNRAYKSRKI